MTSYITKEQYEKMIETIRNKYSNWDGNISSIPIVIEGNFEVTEELKQKIAKIVSKAINKRINKTTSLLGE